MAKNYALNDEFVKCVPAHPNTGYSCCYHPVDSGVRGAFPATYTQEYGEDVYQA